MTVNLDSAPMPNTQSADIDLAVLADDELVAMARSALELRRTTTALHRSDRSLVLDVLQGAETLPYEEHFPEDDIIDHETHSQYYYHSHRGSTGEHGHFHIYLFAAGMPEAFAEQVRACQPPTGARDAFVHFIALSMDKQGLPIGVFTTNRWVCNDAILPAQDLIRLLPRFAVNHAWPSWALNRSINQMLVLFRPQIIEAILRRDIFFKELEAAYDCSREDILNDGSREITSLVPMTLEGQERLLDRELRNRGIWVAD